MVTKEEILSYVGGAIVVSGIAILIYQNWTALGFEVKVLVTLGFAIAAYITGVLLQKNEHTELIGLGFFLISMFVMPIGLAIVFDHFVGNWQWSIVWGIMLAINVVSYLIFYKNIFVVASIIAGTDFYWYLTNFLSENSVSCANNSILTQGFEIDLYRLLIIGIIYNLLGYFFAKNERAELQGPLYFFGIQLLLSTFFLLGWYYQIVELAFPVIALSTMFLGVKIQSKSFFWWSAIFLLMYIFEITYKHFVNSMGWPLALVVVGMAMIGMSYTCIMLKKKYFSA